MTIKNLSNKAVIPCKLSFDQSLKLLGNGLVVNALAFEKAAEAATTNLAKFSLQSSIRRSKLFFDYSKMISPE